MPVTQGIAAALAAPLLEAVGFLEWDIHWSNSGGSAFALNLYKCNLAAFLFLCMTVYVNNEPWLLGTFEMAWEQSNPYWVTAEGEKIITDNMNPVNNIPDIRNGPLMEDYMEKMKQEEMERQRLQAELLRIPNEQLQQQRQQQQQQELQQQQQQETRQESQLQQLDVEQQSLQQQKMEGMPTDQNQNHRRLRDFGEIPIDANEYVILDRRKKTPYDESGMVIQGEPQQVTQGELLQQQQQSQSMAGIDNNYLQLQQFPRNYYEIPEVYHHPFQGHRYQISYIVLSSLLGIVIGDCAELEALRLIGARRVLVVDTIKPFAAAILGSILLDENLYPAAFLGIVLAAVGVYIVLAASMERVEQAKEKKIRGSMKRMEDAVLLPENFNVDMNKRKNMNTSGHGSTGSLGCYSDDAGSYNNNGGYCDDDILSVTNDEEFRIEMIGMHRRPLSRHDLTAEVDELFGQDDNLMMLLEDGRGFMDPAICCGGSFDNFNRSRSNSFGSTGTTEMKNNNQRSSFLGSAWGSIASLDNRSFSSMGSLEDLDMDVMVAMENFERSDSDEFFIGDNEVQGVSRHKTEYVAMDNDGEEDKKTNVHDSRNGNGEEGNKTKDDDHNHTPKDDVPIVSIATVKDKPLKSALKKSRYTPSKSRDNHSEIGTDVGMGKKVESEITANGRKSPNPILPASDIETGNQGEKMIYDPNTNAIPYNEKALEPKKKKTPLRSRTSSSMSLGSNASMVSFESECGPPPDLYGNMRRETKTQRSLRLRTGYLLALLNVLLDAYAAYLTKKHGMGMSTWEINLCRLGFAGLIMSSISYFMRHVEARKKKKQSQSSTSTSSSPTSTTTPAPNTVYNGQGQKNAYSTSRIRPWYRLPRMPCVSWIIVSFGVCFVTFLAPALAQYSLFEIPLALSVSLCSLTPLYTIPLGIIMKGERPSRRGYIGAALSVIGVIILCCFGVDVDSLD